MQVISAKRTIKTSFRKRMSGLPTVIIRRCNFNNIRPLFKKVSLIIVYQKKERDTSTYTKFRPASPLSIGLNYVAHTVKSIHLLAGARPRSWKSQLHARSLKERTAPITIKDIRRMKLNSLTSYLKMNLHNTSDKPGFFQLVL